MSENYEQSRLKALRNQAAASIEVPYDFRNYLVKDDNGNKIGSVKDLLFDVHSKKVRYLIIELEGSSGGFKSRHVLAPIGTVDLAADNNSVVISALTEELIESLPDYIEGKVNPGVENIIRLAYAGESTDFEGAGLTGNNVLNENEDFYSHAHFDTSKLINRQQAQSRQTVNGVFDDGLEAENAITELMSHGFSKDDIELSSGILAANKTGENLEIYNLTSKGGSVVTVKAVTQAEALKASEILDKSGSVSVYENKE